MWPRIRTLIITDDRGQRARLAARSDTRVVGTPLELISMLEHGELISTVLLAGRFVEDAALPAFLQESYPQLGVDWLGAEAG